MSQESGVAKRYFATMSEEKRLASARKGRASRPAEERSFSVDRTLAAEAGRRGGKAGKRENRTFARDPALAAAAGRKGNETRRRKREQEAVM